MDGMVLDRIWLCDIAEIEAKSFRMTTEKAEGLCVKPEKADCVCACVRAFVLFVRAFVRSCFFAHACINTCACVQAHVCKDARSHAHVCKNVLACSG